jgi:hypothetical protein
MLDVLNKNSPLINTLIVYLFIMYLLFMNNPNIKNEVYIVLPTIIYSLFVFLKLNNK